MSTAACSLVGGEDATLTDAGAREQGQMLTVDSGRTVVEVLPPRPDSRALLDPNANPQTPLGRLRARYFPIWTQEFDWAFPPETCGSAWELDAIAETTGGVDISHYGDVPTMAALSVMRYEHLVSRALADATVLAQLCIAVGTVGPARADALDQLQAAVAAGINQGSPRHPREVTVVAVSPRAAVAVACLATAVGPDSTHGNPMSGRSSQARLRAYELAVARGLEDQLVDISYRVSRLVDRTVADCSGLSDWTRQWQVRIGNWIDEGRLWLVTTSTLTVEDLCSAQQSGESVGCPKHWRQ